MQIVTLSDANSDAICQRYRHYPVHIPSLFFFYINRGAYVFIQTRLILSLYVKEVVYKSLFNDFTPIRTNSDRGDFFFFGAC